MYSRHIILLDTPSGNLGYPFVGAAVEHRWAADRYHHNLLAGDIHHRLGSLLGRTVVVVGNVVAVGAHSIRHQGLLGDNLLRHHRNNHYLEVELVDDCTILIERYLLVR